MRDVPSTTANRPNGKAYCRFVSNFTLFHRWQNFVVEALFCIGKPKPFAVDKVVDSIQRRLITVEASPVAVSLYQSLVIGYVRA
jgi:hypothetical protein